MRRMPAIRKSSAGFTLIELIISMLLAIVIVSVFIATLVTSLRSTSSNKTQLELSDNAQVAMDIVERDIRFSTKYRTSIDTTMFQDTNLVNGAWSYRGNPDSPTKRTLILEQYATTQSAYNQSRDTVFYDSATDTYNCSSNIRLNPQLPYTIIYYVADNTLYRRLLTVPTSIIPTSKYCGSVVPAQQQSCKTACAIKDEKIATDVEQFTVTYYGDPNDIKNPFSTDMIDAYATGAAPEVLDEGRSSTITLKLTRLVNFKPVSSTITLRVWRIN